MKWLPKASGLKWQYRNVNLGLLNPSLRLFPLYKLDLEPAGCIWDYSIGVQIGKAEVMARVLSQPVVMDPPPFFQRQV